MEAVNKGMEMTLSEGLYLEAVLFGVIVLGAVAGVVSLATGAISI